MQSCVSPGLPIVAFSPGAWRNVTPGAAFRQVMYWDGCEPPRTKITSPGDAALQAESHDCPGKTSALPPPLLPPPHTLGTPPPPHVCGAVQVPQLSVEPHPSETLPQFLPSALHVVGVQPPPPP